MSWTLLYVFIFILQCRMIHYIIGLFKCCYICITIEGGNSQAPFEFMYLFLIKQNRFHYWKIELSSIAESTHVLCMKVWSHSFCWPVQRGLTHIWVWQRQYGLRDSCRSQLWWHCVEQISELTQWCAYQVQGCVGDHRNPWWACSQQVNKLKYAQTKLIDGEHTFGYLIVHQGINIQQCESC